MRNRNGQRWLADRPGHGNLRWQFVRGYPEEVQFLSVAAWRATWRAVFSFPVRHVGLCQIKDAARLADEPGLAQLRSLTWSNRGSDDALLAILGSPHIGSLEGLSIDWDGGPLLARLVGLPALAGLRSLSVWCAGNLIDEATLQAIVDSPSFAELRELRFVRARLEGRGSVLWRCRGCGSCILCG